MGKSFINKTVVLLFFIQSAAVFAGARISQEGVQARSDGTNVIISWHVDEEINLQHYIVQRRTLNGEFMDVAVINPNDTKYYEYVDESAYKTADKIYVYRIKIVDTDSRVTFTSDVSVHHNVSSVKRTWGSIKALFR